MCFMTWVPAFSVNDEELDRQHKRLIDLINSLHDAMQSGTPKPTVDRVASDFAMYARYHFCKEENLLKRHSYPAIEEHVKEHAEFAEMLDRFVGDLKHGQQTIPEPLLGFLKNWLNTHFTVSDAGYADHLTSSRTP